MDLLSFCSITTACPFSRAFYGLISSRNRSNKSRWQEASERSSGLPDFLAWCCYLLLVDVATTQSGSKSHHSEKNSQVVAVKKQISISCIMCARESSTYCLWSQIIRKKHGHGENTEAVVTGSKCKTGHTEFGVVWLCESAPSATEEWFKFDTP